jgi:hypothetical protein
MAKREGKATILLVLDPQVKEKWKRAAKKADTSLAAFIRDNVGAEADKLLARKARKKAA